MRAVVFPSPPPLHPLPFLSFPLSFPLSTPYLHVGILLHGRETGEVDPGGVLSVAMVVSLLLQLTKRCSSEST